MINMHIIFQNNGILNGAHILWLNILCDLNAYYWVVCVCVDKSRGQKGQCDMIIDWLALLSPVLYACPIVHCLWHVVIKVSFLDGWIMII